METELNSLKPHRRRRRRRLTVASLAGIVIAIISLFHFSPVPVQQAVLSAQPGLWHVSHVVDGDTINVTMGDQKETVRLLGLDTPETHDPRKPVQCFGLAAAAHTKALLEGKDVRLEPDPTDADRDKYHRLLRYIYMPDGTLINAELIRDGYAFAYVIFPLVKLDEFRALETDARTHNRGLWAGCNINESTDIKQTTSTR